MVGWNVDPREFAELRGFLAADGIADPRPYLSTQASPSHVVAVFRLLVPEFVEYRDGVFLGMAFSEPVIDEWFDRLHQVGDVERVVNHVHLWDVIAPGENYELGVARLASLIRASWERALYEAFPHRSFRVCTTEEGGYGPEVYFVSA